MRAVFGYAEPSLVTHESALRSWGWRGLANPCTECMVGEMKEQADRGNDKRVTTS